MKTNSYTTIGIAAGLFTATLVGISIASYIKARRRNTKRTTASENVNINPHPSTAEYTEEMTVQR